MSDLSAILRQGWSLIWKMRTAWLFAALPAITQFSPLFADVQEASRSGAWNSLAGSLIFLILFGVGVLGLPYDVYRFVTGKPATIPETFAALQKYAGRALGCSCVVLLLFLPGLFLIVMLSRNAFLQPAAAFVQLLAVPLLFSIFGAPTQFPLFEFFAKDAGLRQALRESWRLFSAHLYPLVALGLLLFVLTRVVLAATALAAVLIQSGFEAAALGAVNYLDPSPALERNPSFMVLNGVTQTVNSTWQVTVFVLAYLKYGGVEN